MEQQDQSNKTPENERVETTGYYIIESIELIDIRRFDFKRERKTIGHDGKMYKNAVEFVNEEELEDYKSKGVSNQDIIGFTVIEVQLTGSLEEISGPLGLVINGYKGKGFDDRIEIIKIEYYYANWEPMVKED